MQRTMKIVNELPLKSLFCETSSVEYVRGEYLSEGELKKMLTSGPLNLFRLAPVILSGGTTWESATIFGDPRFSRTWQKIQIILIYLSIQMATLMWHLNGKARKVSL